MTRFFLALFGTIVLVLLVLAMFFFKDSYKILPIGTSDPKFMSPYSDWYHFISPKGNFAAKFPTMPQQASQSVRDPKTGILRNYEMYVSEKADGNIFMISTLTYSKEESANLLQKNLINDLLISNPQNKLKDMSVGSFQSFATVDFEITGPLKSINGRTFANQNTIYLLGVVFNSSNVNQEEYNYFTQSFEEIPQ